MPSIFVVEDDDDIRELVCYALCASGFEAHGFEDAQRFWRRLETALPQLVLLDIMLPDEDGVTTLQRLKRKSRTAALPVILLTAKAAEHERVMGLDAGADDYITKPFSILELVSRVKAVLRRVGDVPAQQAIWLGEIMLDPEKRIAAVSGVDVALTYKEFELLHYLMQNADAALSRELILSRVWGYAYEGCTNRTVDMHIKTLRQKLGLAGGRIKTIRGLGYKIVSEGH